MRVEIERMDHNGRGIGKWNGKTVFVPNALPSEIVEIEIVEEKKNYLVGRVLSFIKSSNERIAISCPYFEVCGGCDLSHISYVKELIYKENKVKELVKKYCQVDIFVEPIVGSDFQNYRNKCVLKVQKEMGYYKKNTHILVPITSCFLVKEEINILIESFSSLDLSFIKEITFRTNEIGDTMAFLLVEGEVLKSTLEVFKEKCTTVIQKRNGKCSVLSGRGFLVEKVGNYRFMISPESFFQVNTKGCLLLYEKILEYASLSKEDIVLDLYCGTGTIGIFLSSYCKKVIGVEINESAILDANKNKELNSISNISFFCGDAFSILKKYSLAASIVIVDPPRSGLTFSTIDQILAIFPKRIVYVSCNPITLMRDLNLFSSKYSILKLTPVDMFPRTEHVECVCVMSRR